MARVFIDPHMFSTDWFGEVLEELLASKRVRFLYSRCLKADTELGKVRKALEFYRLVSRLKRADEAPTTEVDKRITDLEARAEFVACRECDDPHIFAAVYVVPAKYVFSCDARMARCRKKMVGAVSKRYLSFIVISSKPTYLGHRAQIL